MNEKFSPHGASRIAALDLIRGIAVMGILIANLPGFALPHAAYFSPIAWGGSGPADVATWAATFVLIEGKMRGLFSLLFGASTLLVIDRARAAGDGPATVHFSRMAWLFAFGCVHLYLFYWGDILTQYALLGAAAFVFVRLPIGWLLATAALCFGWATLNGAALTALAFASAARATPDAAANWAWLAGSYGRPLAADMAREIAGFGGGFGEAVAYRWQHGTDPFNAVLFYGAETLGYMLLGMAALRSGFLTGGWRRRDYALIALAAGGVALAVEGLLAATTIRHGFDVRYVVLGATGVTLPVRVALVIAYAAALMLVPTRGALARRLAAAGRTAFTNYLGTSIVMAAVVGGWGLGLFGRVGRGELYLLALPVWAVMLAWPVPWLARYRYGPLEWAWRSLARFEVQPLRR